MDKLLKNAFRLRRQGGAIDLFVVFCLISIVVAFMFFLRQRALNSYQGAQFDLWNEALEQLRLYYEMYVDCPATQTAIGATCTDGAHLQIETNHPTEPYLIKDSTPYTTVGQFEVRALCSAPTTIIVQARPQPGIKHPFRRSGGGDWTKWADIYRGKFPITRCSL